MIPETDTPPSFAAALTIKLLRIVLPVLGLSAALAVLYSLADWLMVADGWVPLDQDVAALWLPIGLAGVLVALFVVPRVAMLRISERRNGPFLLYIAAAIVIAAPTILAQYYVGHAAGTLTHVADTSQIAAAARTRFYAADTICLARQGTHAQPVFGTSGRREETMDMTLYVAVPVCDSATTDDPSKTIWIALRFDKSIDNALSDGEKDAQFATFTETVRQSVNALDPKTYRFLERARPGEALHNYQKALQSYGIDGSSATFLLPHSEAFEQRTGDDLRNALLAYAGLCILWSALVAFVPLAADKPAAPRPAGGILSGPGRIALRGLILPTRRFYGLPILFDINVGVFLAMVLSGLGVTDFQTDDLLAWGALYRPLMHGWGLLRLVSSQFVHGGLLHVASNMYGLVIISVFMMPVATNARLIALYLLCGLGGAIGSIWYHPATVAVGASGAIFGLCGVLLVLLVLNDPRVTQIRRFALINIGLFVLLNLGAGAASYGIDNAAHVGGLATGTVLGFVLYLIDRGGFPRPQPPSPKIA